MAESNVGWFGVREKHCSLANKPWLISQIRLSEQAGLPGPHHPEDQDDNR